MCLDWERVSWKLAGSLFGTPSGDLFPASVEASQMGSVSSVETSGASVAANRAVPKRGGRLSDGPLGPTLPKQRPNPREPDPSVALFSGRNAPDLCLLYVIIDSPLTYRRRTDLPEPMKSKLTLRLEEDVKERAKRLAKKRGTSVSKIVENYFRLLLREPTGGSASEEGSTGEDSGEESPSPLSSRIQTLRERLGTPAPSVEVDEDTRRWIEAAAEKHS